MSDRTPKSEGLTRREFLAGVGLGTGAVVLAGGLGAVALKSHAEELVWQIDPFKCIRCGNCAVNCVLKPSVVKCVHDFSMCGYCELCFGFFQTEPNALEEGAENQMCPSGAIVRRYVEDPYYQYTIDEKICIGCGKCVEGCNQFGNGSLYLQVCHPERRGKGEERFVGPLVAGALDLFRGEDIPRCLNCNECSIAAKCPADAFVRLPASSPYVLKHKGMKNA